MSPSPIPFSAYFFPPTSFLIFPTNVPKLPRVSQIGNKQLIALDANTQIKLTTTQPVKKPLENTYSEKNMGMGSRKSRMKVKTNAEIHASLKARRSVLGSSSSLDVGARWGGSSVGAIVGGAETSETSFFSPESESSGVDVSIGVSVSRGVVPSTTTALMARVTSQSNLSGLMSEIVAVTIRPVMIDARFPAKVGYERPVVSIVISP
jgi:hypothetical protein